MKAGIRPLDKPVFVEAAKKFQVWLVVRQTNRASWSFVGRSEYFPKPITCKAKTADRDAKGGGKLPRARYETAGLVVDPNVHKNAFDPDRMAGVLELWNDFEKDYLKRKKSDHRESGYTVDRDPKSAHYGCVLYKGKYLYSDYDLYDIIVVGHERANLAVVGKRDEVDDYRPARLFPIEDFINGRIGAEMIHHGGQFQYSEHTNDTVEVFGPKGEYHSGPAAPWYAKNFPHRRPPGPEGGFASLHKTG